MQLTLATMPHVVALEVLMDIARTVGEHRLSREGDTRDDFADFCTWADAFQASFEGNPDAGDTYYEDIEAYALQKALEAGFAPVPHFHSIA